MNQTHLDTRTRRKASAIEAELLEAEKNHAAAVELMELHADRPRFVALAMKSRDRFEAEILRLTREKEGTCPP